jgi:hypothetical protein
VVVHLSRRRPAPKALGLARGGVVELLHGVVVPGLNHRHGLLDHGDDDLRQLALCHGQPKLLNGEDHGLRLAQRCRRLELGRELELVVQPGGEGAGGDAAAHAPAHELQRLGVVRGPLGLHLDQLPIALGSEVAPPRAEALEHEGWGWGLGWG